MHIFLDSGGIVLPEDVISQKKKKNPKNCVENREHPELSSEFPSFLQYHNNTEIICMYIHWFNSISTF